MDEKRKTKKITVRFPKRLKVEMQKSLIESGYGLRGKSRWLKEGIINFLMQPNFFDSVEHGSDINQAELLELEAFYLDMDTIKILKNGFVKVRENYPLFEGVQSAVIRAAVVHRLLKK